MMGESSKKFGVGRDILHCLACKCNVFSSLVSGTMVNSVYPYTNVGVRDASMGVGDGNRTQSLPEKSISSTTFWWLVLTRIIVSTVAKVIKDEKHVYREPSTGVLPLHVEVVVLA